MSAKRRPTAERHRVVISRKSSVQIASGVVFGASRSRSKSHETLGRAVSALVELLELAGQRAAVEAQHDRRASLVATDRG